VCEEGLGDVGEEVGAVDGGDVYGVPAGIIFFGGDDYGRRDGDVAGAAAGVAGAAPSGSSSCLPALISPLYLPRRRFPLPVNSPL